MLLFTISRCLGYSSRYSFHLTQKSIIALLDTFGEMFVFIIFHSINQKFLEIQLLDNEESSEAGLKRLRIM